MEKEPYEYEPHHFEKRKSLPWAVCRHCGLLKLNNAFTEWCIKMGCNASDHPSYKHVLKKLSGRRW